MSLAPTGETMAAPEALDTDKALVLAASAAAAWCSRGTPAAAPGRKLVESLMQAASWVSRARRHRQLAPIPVAELVDCFIRPSTEWLPGGPGVVLVEGGTASPICLELAEDSGTSPLAEVEQRVIETVMGNIAGRPDAAGVYRRFRRFIVEHAHARHADAVAEVGAVGVDLASVYGEVSVDARIVLRGEQQFYPCPRCRWPMRVAGAQVSCASSTTCLGAGARFTLREGALVALGPLESPSPVRCAGAAAVRVGLWRYTVLPGLEELDLGARLEGLPGVEVTLWPHLDQYDLDVRAGKERWRVDLKDYASAMGLARQLQARPVHEVTWVVVPDAKRGQIPVLQRLVPEEARYLFAHSSQFVREVRAAL